MLADIERDKIKPKHTCTNDGVAEEAVLGDVVKPSTMKQSTNQKQIIKKIHNTITLITHNPNLHLNETNTDGFVLALPEVLHVIDPREVVLDALGDLGAEVCASR